jgi:hypothetical protein
MKSTSSDVALSAGSGGHWCFRKRSIAEQAYRYDVLVPGVRLSPAQIQALREEADSLCRQVLASPSASEVDRERRRLRALAFVLRRYDPASSAAPDGQADVGHDPHAVVPADVASLPRPKYQWVAAEVAAAPVNKSNSDSAPSEAPADPEMVFLANLRVRFGDRLAPAMYEAFRDRPVPGQQPLPRDAFGLPAIECSQAERELLMQAYRPLPGPDLEERVAAFFRHVGWRIRSFFRFGD